MATYFIAGASRGIGLELVKEALQVDANTKVIAGLRNPSAATELNELQKKNTRLSIVKIDLSSDQSVKDAAKVIEKSHPQGIDYLIVNGGVAGTGSLEAKEFLQVLDVNVGGPLRVVNEFLPQVKKSSRKVIATISSMAGAFSSQDFLLSYYHSVGEKDPLFYAYRTSKAALNLLTVAFAKDHAKDGVIIIPVHPGMVDTDMYYETGAKKGDHLISPNTSAKQQLAIYHKLKPEDSGKLFSHTGEVVPF